MSPPCDAAHSPFSATNDGVRVRIRLSPRASRHAIAGIVEDGSGGALLKVAVTAAPVDGAANEALLALLARTWRLPKRALSIVAGASDRTKTILVTGDPQALLTRLAVRPVGRPVGRP